MLAAYSLAVHHYGSVLVPTVKLIKRDVATVLKLEKELATQRVLHRLRAVVPQTKANTWQTVHQGRAIQCIGEILTGLDPVNSTLLPHLHEIYALTDDSIEYVHLLGAAMRVLCRLLDQLSTIDQVEELTLVTKLVEMVHTDRSLLPACHVIHCVRLSVLLNPDCVLACIKYGYVAKLMGIVGTLVYKHQKNKRNNPCDSVVAHVVAVVANVSFSPDGRAEICRYGALKDVLTDLLATPSLALPTALLLRNLTFTSIAKAQFVQWKPIMASLLVFLSHENPFVSNFASTAVWSLLHNNQKATTHVVELDWSTHVTDATVYLTQALAQTSNESDRVLLSQAQANLERISQLIECNNADKDDQLKPLDRLAISLNTKCVRRDSTKNELSPLPRVKFDSSSVASDHEDFIDSPTSSSPSSHSSGGIVQSKMASRQQPPPPKPKRNYQQPPDDDHDAIESDDAYAAPIQPRRGRSTRAASQSPPSSPQSSRHTAVAPLKSVEGEAETTIGAAVKMKGELSFERLLRIEGEFEGKLVSKGSLVIGQKGLLTGNIDGMKEVLVAGGRVIGNITVERLVLRDKGQIFGNVTAKSIRIDPECILMGTLNVNPHAPQRINLKGEPVVEEPKPVAPATPATPQPPPA
ncbi:hypothetical protein B5M09_007719 [Aphanomyces astaci]|uniref:Polymer-forming cytoskeletal protein n=1 Tax=Aphanomyces astaci TaxID=112090 RepID=A0A3R7Y170_APHAT|nr:hypothetical protein B5M09_007719 [Aphanomyces astaci]